MQSMLIVHVYILKKILNFSTIEKNHLKCNVIICSVVNGLRQPLLYSFDLGKLSGYKVFCHPGAIHYKKMNLFLIL